jgi:hypothetical protein
MEVKQQHMCHKTHHKPKRRFHDSLESRCHDQRIPHCAALSRAQSARSGGDNFPAGIPRWSNFDCSVVRFNPRRAAAPSGPPIAAALLKNAKNAFTFSGPQARLIGNRLRFGEGRPQHRTRSENDRPFDIILQLSAVSRPLPTAPAFPWFSVNAADGLFHSIRELVDEMLDSGRRSSRRSRNGATELEIQSAGNTSRCETDASSRSAAGRGWLPPANDNLPSVSGFHPLDTSLYFRGGLAR